MIREGQELYFLIEWPDGQVRRIPLVWTDQAVVEPAKAGARFTPGRLLTLRRWLDAHLRVVAAEDGSAGVPALEGGLTTAVSAAILAAARRMQ